MEGTGLFQGKFVSAGTTTVLAIPSGADWIRTYNYTQIAAQTNSTGYEFYYQFGMPMGAAIETKSNAGSTAVNEVVITTGGFSIYNPLTQPFYGKLNNGSTGIAAISTATPPVVTVGSTAGMFAGNVVRLISTTGALQFGGMEFTIGYGTLDSTHFSLDYAPTIAAGTGGNFYVVEYPPYFVPPSLWITAIASVGITSVVTLSVQHNYKVGQEIRMVVPAAFGMIQMDGLLGTIIAVDTATGNTHNTITLNIDSSSFTAFAFPTSAVAAAGVSPAKIVPVGENINAALSNPNLLDDRINNQAFVGMTLGAGANGPAGVANDVIYWVAGTASLGGQ